MVELNLKNIYKNIQTANTIQLKTSTWTSKTKNLSFRRSFQDVVNQQLFV